MDRDDERGNATRRIRGPDAQALPTDVLPPGTTVGDYRVTDLIAVGGFGAVYRVEHVLLGRPAALKILHRELGATGDAARRFEREAKAVNVIRHPNVVDIFDFGRLSDGQPFFVMELLNGQDLQSYIESRGRLTVDETISTLEPLCSALDAAHAHGIVHRDLKASNVFRQERQDAPRIVLLDFGVAKLLSAESGDLTTASQLALGTPACMAPEQIAGGEVTARTDVYALGALAYHMLTGMLPFAGTNITLMQQMHVHAQRPAPSSVVPSLQIVDEVIARAMRRKPEERYASASELLEDLRRRVAPPGMSPSRTRSERGAGVHLEMLIPPSELDEPDERLLDDIASIAGVAHAVLTGRGFERVLDASTSALFVRVLEPGRPEDAQVQETVQQLQEVLDTIAARARQTPVIAVSLVVHVGDVLLAEGRIHGGALLELGTWVPRERVPGIQVT